MGDSRSSACSARSCNFCICLDARNKSSGELRALRRRILPGGPATGQSRLKSPRHLATSWEGGVVDEQGGDENEGDEVGEPCQVGT